MIRAGVLEHETPTLVRLTDVCPACDGNGTIRTGARDQWTSEPVAETCWSCAGTGVVAAEAVVHCAQPDCGAPIWADRACTHGTDSPLCSDHRPTRCAGCIDEAGGLDR